MGTEPSTSTPSLGEDVVLDRIVGPPVGPFDIDGSSRVVIGRSRDCDISLPDEVVSRVHAAIEYIDDEYQLTDLGSRHGTALNNDALEPMKPHKLSVGDDVRIGPWVFRVRPADLEAFRTLTIEDTRESTDRIETIRAKAYATIAAHRLDMLIQSSEAAFNAPDERSLSGVIGHAALTGSAYDHVAILRPLSDAEEVEILHVEGRQELPGRDQFQFSRSLVKAAMRGEIVRLIDGSPQWSTGSVVSLDITAALCVPIFIGPAVDAVLYLDRRSSARGADSDSPAFCQALARIYGLALANFKRQQIEKRQLRIEREMEAAREAQEFLLPASSGRTGSLQYSVRMIPGLLVAGDFYDIVELDDGKMVIVLGDVSGKGYAAGLLMAGTLSGLHNAITHSTDLSEAVRRVNMFLTQRSSSSRFVTLWAGIFDPETHKLTFIDAGHGLWLMRRHGEPTVANTRAGGPPLGIAPDFPYEVTELTLEPGDRMAIISDGVVEQPGAGDLEHFGVDRCRAILDAPISIDDITDRVFDEIAQHAQGLRLADDTTILVFEIDTLNDDGPESA